MPAVVYGYGVFSAANHRDRVARQGERSLARAGFIASPLAGERYGPGVVSTSYTWPPLDTDNGEVQDPALPVPGAVSPAISFAMTHTDPAMVDLARDEILSAMDGGGWLRGECGTVYVVD